MLTLSIFMLDCVNSVNVNAKISTFPSTQEIVMKNVIKTQSDLAKFILAASFCVLGCTAIGGTALAEAPSGRLYHQRVGNLSG